MASPEARAELRGGAFAAERRKPVRFFAVALGFIVDYSPDRAVRCGLRGDGF
jgi:hypothetical protein